MTLDPVTLAAGLRALRERRGWSQAELGERIGMLVPNVSRLEAGGSLPSTTTLAALAGVYGWRAVTRALDEASI